MKRNGKTFSLTWGAMLTALSVAVLWLSAAVPSGRWALVAVAGLMPTAAVVSGGMANGFAVYAATAALGLLVVPDKLNGLLYLMFFGLYPMVKSLLERLRKRTLSWVLKFLFFDLILCLWCFALGTLFMPTLPHMLLKRPWLMVTAGNVIFALYDLGLSQLIGRYLSRLGKMASDGGRTDRRD